MKELDDLKNRVDAFLYEPNRAQTKDYIDEAFALGKREGAGEVVTALEMTSCCDDGGANGSCDCQNINLDAAREKAEEVNEQV